MLELSTQPMPPRDVVVDGVPYPLTAFEAIDLVTLHRLTRAWAVLRQLAPRPSLAPTEQTAIIAALDILVHEALPTLPADQAAALTPQSGLALAGVFLTRGLHAA